MCYRFKRQGSSKLEVIQFFDTDGPTVPFFHIAQLIHGVDIDFVPHLRSVLRSQTYQSFRTMNFYAADRCCTQTSSLQCAPCLTICEALLFPLYHRLPIVHDGFRMANLAQIFLSPFIFWAVFPVLRMLYMTRSSSAACYLQMVSLRLNFLRVLTLMIKRNSILVYHLSRHVSAYIHSHFHPASSSMGATKAALILIDAHCTRLLGIVRKTDDASATTAFVQNGALQSCIGTDRRRLHQATRNRSENS